MKNKLLHIVVMLGKFTVYGLVLYALLINVLLANEGNAQSAKSVKEVKIDLTVRNASLEYVFEQIEEVTDYTFVYYRKSLDRSVRINLKAENQTVEELLLEIARQGNVSFRQVNNRISVKNSPDFGKDVEVIIDQASVSGRVTDENGEGLPGATILVKGTSNGTVSDMDGYYKLEMANSEEQVLIISFIGYLTQEIPVNGRSVIDATLQPDFTSLKEVVVIGYGTVEKRDLTGAVSSVKSEEIAMAPTASPIEAIQGRVAGLDVSRSSGQTGSEVSLLLRGNRSLTASSEPIYIIDGIWGDITNLNPNDIASIDVLKDASSTAIYGSAGANGVIIITTKKGAKGKMQVDFSSYVSINDNPSFASPLQGEAWLKYLEEGYVATHGTAPADRDELLAAWSLSPTTIGQYINNGQYINWVDETFQRGIQTNNTLSLRGGTEKMQASFSVGHNKTEGVYQDDKVDMYTMRSDLSLQTAEWAKFGITAGLIYRDRESNRSRINKAFAMVPLGEVRDENGKIKQYPIDDEPGIVSVLANNIEGTYEHNTKYYNVTANPYAEFTLARGLTFRSRLGISVSSSREGEFKSDHTYLMLTGSENAIRSGSYNTTLDYFYNWENIVNYDVSIAADHKVGATLITSWMDTRNESGSAYSEGFLYDDFRYYNLDAGINSYTSSDYSEKKRMSYAARLNYSYRGKYLFTGTIRYDGVSQLAKKWDVFPAAAVAWRISDEGFMSGASDVVTNLKLRVGYGVTGNSNIDAYVTKSEITNGPDRLNFGGGQVLTSIPTQTVGNDNLGWEKSYNLNVGLDFGLFNNRIDGTLEVYNTDTRDVIYQRPLPFSGGGYTAKEPYTQNANIATMQNQGVELTLNTWNVDKGDFKWNSTLTFSRNREEVTSIKLGANTSLEDLVSLGLFIGSPKDVFFDYQKTGIWQLGEEADAAVFGLAPGDVKVASSLTKRADGVWVRTVTDEDGNTVEEEYTAENPYTINADDDRRILGQAAPSWFGGLQNTFVYKGFDLGIFATARWGQMIDGSLMGHFRYGNVNIPDNYDYWTETNPTNDYPRPYISRSTAASEPVAALTYVDASYIKIKNITLGYTLPESLISRIGLSNFRVYSTLYNALIITKSHLLKGVDPEAGASDSFPLYRQMVFGLNVSF